VGISHISTDKTQFGTMDFSQMVDGGCFVMMSAALTVNFVVLAGEGHCWRMAITSPV
jgi:hypothetical protein